MGVRPPTARELCTRLLGWLRDTGALPTGRTAELEAERLRALLDGLTLHLLLNAHPRPAEARRILRQHVTELLA